MSELQDKQKKIYNAFQVLNNVGVCLHLDGEVVKHEEYWVKAGRLALRLQKQKELFKARQTLAVMQAEHTKQQAKLQETINHLQVN